MDAPLPRPAVGVGVVLTRPDGTVLVGHRVTAGESPSWCLPGGHLEGGETPVAAAVRETAEEAGLRVAGTRVLAVCVRTAGSNVTFAVHAEVGADARPEVLEPHAMDEWRWCRPDDLPEPLFSPSAAVLHAWRGGTDLAGWAIHPLR
ncbi:NUDIX hydrolase [Pseudonocardia ailaonensis]|uniref:NUDIX hydrolase n=1 Tax=Pseudonocardia ailaonensis TaxID=367279 RepID=A0ABN2MS36_9PSEU